MEYKKIYIKDSQQAYYTDILNYYSAYPTENQNVKLILPSEEEYKKYFVESYCDKSPILTWDGLPVFF